MSIADRLEEARLLWSQGRKEGAFIMILIAAAATSRKRYPRETLSWAKKKNDGTRKEMEDGEAFKRFILDEMGDIIGGPKYNVTFVNWTAIFRRSSSTRFGPLPPSAIVSRHTTARRRMPSGPSTRTPCCGNTGPPHHDACTRRADRHGALPPEPSRRHCADRG